MATDAQATWRRRTLVLGTAGLAFGGAYAWFGTRYESEPAGANPPSDEPLTGAERRPLVEIVRSGRRTLEHPTLGISFAYPEGFRLVSSGPLEPGPDASAAVRKTVPYLQMYELDEDPGGARMILAVLKAKGPRDGELVLPTYAAASINRVKQEAKARGVSYQGVRDEIDKRTGRLAARFEAILDGREHHGARSVAVARGTRGYLVTLRVQAPAAETLATLLDSLAVAP